MKRYIVIFAICFFSLYFLLSGLFGEKGYFYNKSLRIQIQEKRLQAEKLSNDIENLKNQRIILDTGDGLRDSAMNLGYHVNGDTVYLFDTVSLQKDIIDNNKTDSLKLFKPLSKISILLVDFGISLIFTFLIWFLSKKDDTNPEDEDVSLDYYDENTYINA